MVLPWNMFNVGKAIVNPTSEELRRATRAVRVVADVGVMGEGGGGLEVVGF